MATVRHVAEGAARESHADKRARFVVARGEVAELDATLGSALRLRLVPDEACKDARGLAARVGAMLTGLIKREDGRRAGRSPCWPVAGASRRPGDPCRQSRQGATLIAWLRPSNHLFRLTLLISEILRIGSMTLITMKPTTRAMATIRSGSSRLVTFWIWISTSSS